MDSSSAAVVMIFLLVQIIQNGDSLQCYTCVPEAQGGEDCGQVRSDQLRMCAPDQDRCRSIAVSLPASGTRSLTINRGCTSSNDYSGSAAGFLQAGLQSCTTTSSEGQRVSKLCLCSYDSCNSYTLGQLTDTAMFGGSGAASLAGGNLVTGLFAAMVVAFGAFLA